MVRWGGIKRYAQIPLQHVYETTAGHQRKNKTDHPRVSSSVMAIVCHFLRDDNKIKDEW